MVRLVTLCPLTTVLPENNRAPELLLFIVPADEISLSVCSPPGRTSPAAGLRCIWVHSLSRLSNSWGGSAFD